MTGISCRTLCIILTIVLFTLFDIANATTYYVRTDGNNVNAGTSNTSAGAWQTIQKCANTMQSGDTCRVQTGTYIENNILFKISGNSANWITYTCDGTCNVKGTNKNIGNIGFSILGASYLKFENFALSTYFVGIKGDQYLGNYVNNIIIKNVKVTDVSYDGIGFAINVMNITLDSVDVSYFGDHGIGFYALSSGQLNRNITIKNSRIYTNTGESGQYHNGIDIHTNVWDVTLQNNTIWNIRGSQSAMYIHNWNVKRVNIKDNHIYNSDRGMIFIGVSDSIIENNLIENIDTYLIAVFQDSPGAEPNNNLTFRNNILRNQNRWEACVRIQRFYDTYNTNILFDNNSITGCSNGQAYSLLSDNNINITIRNEVESTFKIEVVEAPPVNSFVEYTDGRTFSVGGVGGYTSYAISSLGTPTINVIGYASIGNITGTVRDVGTGFGISGATVASSSKSAQTNSNGGYLLANIPNGTQQVTASRQGYVSEIKQVNVINGSTVNLDFNLIAAIPPAITSYSPTNLNPAQNEGTTNTFTVAVNQPVTSRWLLDDIQQSTVLSYTKQWSYTDAGTHNITYIGDNSNGTISKTWIVTVNNVADTTPPVIANVASSPSTTTATITWTTDEPSTSQVEYGLNTNYSLTTPSDSNLANTHSITIAGLTNNMSYHYRVKSKNADGYENISGDYTFTTLQTSTNIVGWWSFDDGAPSTTASDLSGNTNTGTIYGAAWTAGKIGSALQFDGVSNYVRVPRSSSVELSNTNLLTLSAWVKRGSTGSNGLIVKKGIGAQGGYVLAHGNNPCSSSDIKATKYGVTDICIGSFPADTNWHYIVEMGNSTGTYVFVDGVLNGASNNAQNWALNTDDLYIGGSPTTSDISYFNGTIDEVKIYNRSLSAQEIKAEYDAANRAYVNVTNYFYSDSTITYASAIDGKVPASISALPTSGNVSVFANIFTNTLVNFSADTSNGNNVVAFIVNGFKPNTNYLVRKDGINLTTVQADSSGKLSFNNSIW